MTSKNNRHKTNPGGVNEIGKNMTLLNMEQIIVIIVVWFRRGNVRIDLDSRHNYLQKNKREG